MTKEIVIPSNSAELKTIQVAIKEANDSLIRIAAERELIKDIVADLNEKYEGLPKKYINKMIKTYYKNSFDKESTEHDDFSELFVAVTEVK
jgi:hypothetical protein